MMRRLLFLAAAVQTTALAPAARRPEPSRLENTQNYRDATAASARFNNELQAKDKKKTVAIIGGGLSGLSCAKYLSDAGHAATVYEARDVLGGKVSAWQDADGDWIETGLHIFFGAYPNMMNLLKELKIRDRLQWKPHRMSFAMRQRPGEFTNFEFPANVPAPFNMAAAILTNREMLSLVDKIKMVPGLLPMLIEGQDFIDAQDELSVLEFMEKYGMPDTVNEEIFIAMAKALDFTDPDRMSMTVILTAMNRFINEADGSQTAFLDGNQPDRVCAPIAEHVRAAGGDVLVEKPLERIDVNDDGSIARVVLRGGEEVLADEYVSALPVDVLKRVVPEAWSTLPYFRQLDELEGIPVMNLQLWFDTKFESSLDGLAFSRSPLLSVYADMSICCEEYASDETMLELVFAPVTPETGASRNWLAASDEEVVEATLDELRQLFPDDLKTAKLRKSTVVRVPRSVYAAVPGRNKYRPSQKTPIPNLTLCGCFTSQKYLGSMEGAVLAGKLAAEVVAARAVGAPTQDLKEVQRHVVDAAATAAPKKPVGCGGGDSPIAFGGGEVVAARASR
uniref:Amine oxidase n=1 Tax=Pelagomonas calceolata TaxID=35677 RepID=A0A7S4EA13_9STRA